DFLQLLRVQLQVLVLSELDQHRTGKQVVESPYMPQHLDLTIATYDDVQARLGEYVRMRICVLHEAGKHCRACENIASDIFHRRSALLTISLVGHESGEKVPPRLRTY